MQVQVGPQLWQRPGAGASRRKHRATWTYLTWAAGTTGLVLSPSTFAAELWWKIPTFPDSTITPTSDRQPPCNPSPHHTTYTNTHMYIHTDLSPPTHPRPHPRLRAVCQLPAARRVPRHGRLQLRRLGSVPGGDGEGAARRPAGPPVGMQAQRQPAAGAGRLLCRPQLRSGFILLMRWLKSRMLAAVPCRHRATTLPDPASAGTAWRSGTSPTVRHASLGSRLRCGTPALVAEGSDSVGKTTQHAVHVGWTHPLKVQCPLMTAGPAPPQSCGRTRRRLVAA